jgi:hypothetical protein
MVIETCKIALNTTLQVNIRRLFFASANRLRVPDGLYRLNRDQPIDPNPSQHRTTDA